MKPKVAVLTTGGTIAGVSHGNPFTAHNGQSVRHYNVELSGSELLSKFPNLEEIADIELLDLGVIDSVNMTPALWDYFAQNIFAYLQRDDISGVVLTHGTDTLEYTSMALAMMLQNPNKPVVLTGAMLPFDQDEDHVRRHLEDSVRLAGYSPITDTVLCFSGDSESTFTNVYKGVHVEKLKSRGNDAFGSQFARPIAEVRNREVNIAERYESTRQNSPTLDLGSKYVAPVNITGMEGDIFGLDFSKEAGVLVYSNLGVSVLRNVRRIRFVEKLLDAGVPVTIGSNSSDDMYLHQRGEDSLLDRASFVGKMPFSKAITKMGWVVAQTGSDVVETKGLMETDYAGEILDNHYER